MPEVHSVKRELLKSLTVNCEYTDIEENIFTFYPKLPPVASVNFNALRRLPFCDDIGLCDI